MRKMQDVLVYGVGGHAKVTIELLEQTHEFRIKGLLDDAREQWGKICAGYMVLGNLEMLEERGFGHCKIALGVAKPEFRRRMFEAARKKEFFVVTLIHPEAYVARGAEVGEGAMVMARAVVNTEATIGRGTVVNTGAIVEHECKIGDFVHLGPGAHLAGKVTVKDGAFVGLGATILEFLEIGEGAVVGAGAVVTKNVAPGITVVGNPARALEKKHDSHS